MFKAICGTSEMATLSSLEEFVQGIEQDLLGEMQAQQISKKEDSLEINHGGVIVRFNLG